jgi:zinc/manganese transport system substrate-binding protein
MGAAARWIVVGTVLLAACGGSGARGPGPIQVVAGQNFWGSIASQLGGSKVEVQSVVSDPNADPHEYQSSTANARAFADADLVVLNGAGYDDWGQRLLSASSSSHRQVLDIARLLGRKAGDNPHFWYDPAYVVDVADAITARYRSIDAADAGYFDQRRSDFTSALKPYLDEVAAIKQKYSGTPIGSTESVFVYMAAALGLDLISPPEFMQAVAQGTDPPVSAVASFHDQVAGNRIKVLVYNVQTATAVTTNLKTLAAAHHIPTVGVSETLQPENLAFQDWQLAQLRNLEGALSAAG